MKVALVSRELYPLSSGGIGAFVAAAARLLSRIAEVTIVTSSSFQERYGQLRRDEDERLPPESVRVAFVREPTENDVAGWYDVVQCYGASVLERLRELYPDGGPDVIEFPDYLGEAFVTVQAAQALDGFLDDTCVCVRLHSTQELCVVLNAHYRLDFASRAQFEMERYSLAHADRLIWEGGDVLGTYERFYGAAALAPSIRIRYPYSGPTAKPAADAEFDAGAPLRILYAGRLERRKGVHNLIAAARGLQRDDFRLTLIGADTQTGPLGVSMRGRLELEIADDPRIKLHPPVERRRLADTISSHDVVVIPSLWECWPYAALEALHCNRPVLATPVGGLVELVAPQRSGWLAAGTDSTALTAALELVLDDPAEITRLVRSGEPIAHATALSSTRVILDRYQELAQIKPRRRPSRVARRSAPPLVSAIVPYYHASRYVAQTIQSLLAQTHPRLEIVLVNDGSFDQQDWVIAELAARAPIVVVSQVNSGLGAARNFGISQSRGRYVFPLDADNFVHRDFVSRCVEVLERRPACAYVTSWSRYVAEDGTPAPGPLGYQPLGNQATLVSEQNVAGDAAAVIPRAVFDAGFAYSEQLASYEDWHFYRELHRAGRFGAIIPERLLYYRVRPDSMQAQIAEPRRPRLEGEIEALLRGSEVQWTSSSA